MNIENDNPLVSVIIPTYKRPRMLGRAIDSVLNQTYDNIEIIIVDDNDEDNKYRIETQKFMNQYSDISNIVYMKHKKNKNGAAARNTGIRNANGKYIAFLDDDDEFSPRKIELQLNKIINSSEKYDAVYCGYSYYKNNKKIKTIYERKEGDLQLDLLLMNISLSAGSTLLIKKEILNKLNGFDESFYRHQDWEFLVRFFRDYKIGFVNEKLVSLYIDDNSNKIDSLKLYKLKKQYLSKFEKDIEKYEQKTIDKIYYKHYLKVMNKFINERKINQAYKIFIDYKIFNNINPKDILFILLEFFDSILPLRKAKHKFFMFIQK